LGYVEVDLGNPIQYDLFVEMLFHRKQLDGYRIYEAWPEKLKLSDDFPPYERHAAEEWEFETNADPLPVRASTSVQGAKSKLRIEAAQSRLRRSLRSRVVRKALDGDAPFTLEAPIDQEAQLLSKLPSEEFSAESVRKKLTYYALNSKHEVGRHKARVFAETLGVTQDEWLYLAAQISRNIATGEIYNVRQDTFGLKFSVRLDVTGLNRTTATIESGWIIDNGNIRLVTAYVADKNQQHRNAEPHSYRIEAPNKQEAYQQILDLSHAAGAAAVEGLQPTPLLLSMDGRTCIISDCGAAYVIVPDARRGFARWLLKTGAGTRGIRGGAAVSARVDQSVERATAYAEAFAKVLRENSIVCSVAAVED